MGEQHLSRYIHTGLCLRTQNKCTADTADNMNALCTPQREVEQYYIVNGYLFPKFHKFYWSGLYAPKAWPFFRWIEPTFPPPATANYLYWGVNDALNASEPDQKTGKELCGGSNVSYVDADNTWGWGDFNCSSRQTYLCRIMREWPMPGSPCGLIL
jgi:hypothetical protein